MVVIAVIGILAAVVLASMNSARQKNRDSVRKQSLVQLRTALELYLDANGTYPVTYGAWLTSNPTGDPSMSHNGGDWIPGLVAGNFIDRLPQDPLGGIGYTSGPCAGVYHRSFVYVSTNGSGYKLVSHCAPEGTWSSSDAFYDPIRPSHGWMVCTGSECTL